MIDTHNPPAPGGPGLPPPPRQPGARAGAAAAAQTAEAEVEALLFTGPDRQLVQQRWQQAAA